MCTHLTLISTLISTDPSWSRERTTRQAMASGYHQRLATAMRSGIDWHVHSPNFNLHADIHGSILVQRAHNQTGNGIRITPETSYSNEKWKYICMCTHLNLISTLISTHPSRSRERTTRQAMASGYHQRLATAMRSGIDWHVHSPKFNLHADIHRYVSVQRAHNQKQWHQVVGRD